MTIVTMEVIWMAKAARQWGVAKAKAQFSKLLDCAMSEGPQAVTRNGRDTVIIISAKEWERKTRQKGSLAEFLASSPLRGSGLRVTRSKTKARKIRL